MKSAAKKNIILVLWVATILQLSCEKSSKPAPDFEKTCVPNRIGGSLQGCAAPLEISTTPSATSMPAPSGTGWLIPFGVTVVGGEVYVADWSLSRIVKSGSTSASFLTTNVNHPQDITSDGKNIFWTDNGSDTVMMSALDSPNATLFYDSPGADFITTEGIHLFVHGVSGSTAYMKQIRISDKQLIATFNTGVVSSVNGLTTDGLNLFWSYGSKGKIQKLDLTSGLVSDICPDDTLGYPYGLTTDGRNLFVLVPPNIVRVDIATGTPTTLTGLNLAIDATGIATDGVYLYVTDTANRALKRIQ